MRNCSSLGFQRQNILTYDKPLHAVVSHIAPDKPVETEIHAFCALQHIYVLARGTNHLLEHEKVACCGVILVDTTCFLICETDQYIFSVSV